MMIKTAGGPGLVCPIDFHERRSPRMSRAAWAATGIVVAAHVGLGAALYYQRFEMPAPVEPAPERVIDVITIRPKPPEPVKPATTPPAPNTATHRTPAPQIPVETFETVVTDAPPTTGATVTFREVVEVAVPDSRATEPTPVPAPVITNPSWLRQPSGDQLMRAYPPRALNAEVSGAATLNCLVQANGSVTDCAVTRETPGGYGFGRAAQGLSRHFQINPRTVDGAAQGSRVNINLRFALPEG